MRNIIYSALLACSCLPAFCLIGADPKSKTREEYMHMDTLALEAGTDKSSAFHNYTKVYSQYFAPIKSDPIKFLEIGIYKGDSVKMWEAYLPNAELHFIDITGALIEYQSTRSYYHFLDQSDAKALELFGHRVGGNYDVIIDDGGHTMTQQLTSFHWLFPLVKSGGLYIIEDLHTSYWKTYGGKGNLNHPQAGAGTAVEFLKNLVEHVNYVGAATACADSDKVPPALMQRLNYYQSQIESIHFYSSVCIIRKK